MASVSSLGVGSGLDLESMVTKLMSAERAPIDALTTKITSAQTKISLFGTLSTKLSALQTAADTLQFPSRLAATKATSGDTSIVTATSAFGATAGTYGIEVTQLASAQKSFTQEYTAGTTFTPGSLSFTVAGTPAASIDLNEVGKTSYTLDEVRDKINAAKIGVTATVVNTSSGGQRMILTSDNSGATNGFSLTSGLTASGGQANLDGANFDTTTPGLARASAQNGLIKIDGVEVSSATNVFTNIAGLSITASKVSTPGVATSLKVETDNDKVVSAVKALVDAYNGIASTIKSNSAYNSATKTAQPLNGDFAARTISSGLSGTLTTVPAELASATYKTLSELGVSITQTGQLTLDETKLRQALSKSPSDTLTTLQAYGKAFSDSAGGILSSEGVLTKRVSSLNDAVKIYKDNQASLEVRMVAIEKRFRAQFTAMDKLVAQFKSTSSQLTQIFNKSSS
ncbi:flagellar filament capping protein FliD [uncultured Dechloromonas sp.]|uniref:flagellar filament capping protein FliD n=1 Tax=uncultured Dechloromonas sp. TaxID=171719 RepID=UPI0025F6B477|nr:flagellar filament capping protein FliD [uncultured Dechloromonas sp.]